MGEYFRNKYSELPNLADNFDLIYNEIINYCKDNNKIIVIDCAQFHCCKDISILKLNNEIVDLLQKNKIIK